MEPLTIAGAYASIIGLIGNYRSETKSKELNDYNEFIEWLSTHRHEEIRTLIESNHKTSISVKALLSQNTEKLLDRLSQVDKLLAAISTKIDGLASLAEAIHPDNKLSEQAIDILSNLEASGSSNFYIIKTIGSPPIIDFRNGTAIKCGEPRFMESDIESLVDAGFLTIRHTKVLEYHITRPAVEYLKAIDRATLL